MGDIATVLENKQNEQLNKKVLNMIRDTQKQMSDLRIRIHETTDRVELARLRGQMQQMAKDAEKLVEVSQSLLSEEEERRSLWRDRLF